MTVPREIINYARDVVEKEGAVWVGCEPTNNGHYRLLFNIGNAREMYIMGHRMASYRHLENIRSGIRRKVRAARENMK